MTQACISEKDLSLVRWRARRGLLENDLMLTRFLDAKGAELTEADVEALMQLLKIEDNPLMDLLLGRTQLEGEYNTPAIQKVLNAIRHV